MQEKVRRTDLRCGRRRDMKKNIYISCEKNKKELYKELVEKSSQNLVVVSDLSDADACLVMGIKGELMEEEIIRAEQADIEVKTINDVLIQTGMYKSILSGIEKPKTYRKDRAKEL